MGKCGCLQVHGVDDVDRYLGKVVQAAAKVHACIRGQNGDPLDLLRKMKFDEIGCHPIDGHALNFIEQVNQTWTYIAALVAARCLLDLHPDARGFRLAPGADAVTALDIMSEAIGLVGAETFAAVDPTNNRKLDNDLKKLATRPERHRYVFFMSPRYPGTGRISKLERDGVQVWSVDL